MADDPEIPERELLDECELVLRNRRREALEYGLTPAAAQLFAESSVDIGVLRKLADAGCPPAVGRRILL